MNQMTTATQGEQNEDKCDFDVCESCNGPSGKWMDSKQYYLCAHCDAKI